MMEQFLIANNSIKYSNYRLKKSLSYVQMYRPEYNVMPLNQFISHAILTDDYHFSINHFVTDVNSTGSLLS